MLKIGSAMVDLTPPIGTHLSGSGMGEYRPAETVLDRLFARAVVFENGDRRICLLQLDLCIVTDAFTARVREAAARQFGFHPDAIMVHPMQSHSAPSCGFMMLDPDFPLELTPATEYLTGGESAYFEFAAERSIQAIGLATGALQPARVAAGRGVLDRFAFNRRGLLRKGGVGMPWPAGRARQPLGPTEYVGMEGPSDPEVGVLCAYDAQGVPMTLLLHHTCHPVCVFATKGQFRAVSADWPGAWSSAMAAAGCGGSSPVVINGCCGNINPWDPMEPDFIPDHEAMGAALAALSRKILERMEPCDDATVDYRVDRIELDYRDIPPARRAEVERILSLDPQPRWRNGTAGDIDPEWFMAASTRSIDYCKARMPRFVYEIQVFRIGPAVIVGLPGEPFVEGQLALKVRSRAPYTFVAHLTSQYVGYIPTADACARGGHEANPLCTYWAKLAPDSLERIIDRAGECIAELYA